MISIPDPNSSVVVSDWVELFVTLRDQHVSKAILSRMLEGASGVEPKETFISDIWRELINREKLYSVAPFKVELLSIEPNDGFSPKIEYCACLIMSLFGAEAGAGPITKLFERLTSEAVKRYLSGEANVFGWPTEEGTQASIKTRIIEVSNRLNEKFAESPAEKYKDRGLDVIGWKPFGEKRSSQIVVLLQCAAGINWRKKTMDLPMRAWEQYIHWACNPIKAFAVPCIISSREWHDVSKEAGILFDRIRILNLLQEGEIDEDLGNELEVWINNKLTELN